MPDHHRYVANENVERFEALLRAGRLDPGQIEVVTHLLRQARAELALLDEPGPLICVAGGPVQRAAQPPYVKTAPC